MSSDDRKQNSADNSFLSTAARAVGGTLGKLAVKTGLAGAESPQTPAAARPVRKKKTAVKSPTSKRAPKSAAKKKKLVKKRTISKPSQR